MAFKLAASFGVLGSMMFSGISLLFDAPLNVVIGVALIGFVVCSLFVYDIAFDIISKKKMLKNKSRVTNPKNK